MTVKELIELLEGYDEDMLVVAEVDDEVIKDIDDVRMGDYQKNVVVCISYE